jgi:hypothetical protein
MSGIPQFAATPITDAIQVSVANANRDGTGTVGTLYTAPTNGARIDEISIKAGVTTTAGMVRLFLHDGTSYFLWKEILVPAITASATVASFETVLTNLGLILANGWSIRASTEQAQLFNIAVTQGGEF